MGLGGRHDRDVHPSRGIDRVVVDLREDQLLGHAERVVPSAVERPGVEAPEVTDAGDGEADQAIQELPHAGTPEGDLGADQIGRATSELQSLMRISYAGLCLKKNKYQTI